MTDAGHQATSALPPRVAIIVSRFNGSITARLLEGARSEYRARGGRDDSLAIFEAPGSFELPALALAAAETGRYRGIAALGCLIKGQTRHDRYIAEAVAHGLTQASLQTGVPITFGVLTVDSPKQARARASGGQGNKGADAMAALLGAISSLDAIAAGRPLVALSLIEPRPDKAARPVRPGTPQARLKPRKAAGKTA
jgi:6,7-dimethyl-8-ribityllumazine synthase